MKGLKRSRLLPGAYRDGRGKKIPELDALTMAYNAVQQGAAGVDMGRNIFQSEAPTAMIHAVRAVVHGDETPKKAFDLYNTLKNESKTAPLR